MLPSSLVVIYVGSIFVELSIFMYVCMAINLFDLTWLEITSLTIVCPTVYSNADHRKHQSAASLAFVRGIHRGPVNSPHKWPVMRKMFPFDDIVMSRIDKEALSKNIQTHLINLLIDPTDTSVDEEIPCD